MKKLIIAAAIVCAAVVSQAAAVGWSCACGATWKNGDYSVFVLGMNGVSATESDAIAQIKALVADGGISAADSLAFYKGGKVNGSGAANLTASSTGPSITYSGEGTDTYTALIFVEDAAGENASYTASKNITMTNDSTSKTWTFTSQATNLTSHKFDVAPEPTSGLLLLVGVAGLALRRRRA